MIGMMGHGRLGVRIESLNSDLGSYFGAADGKGVLVLEVVKDTPAERAGIKAGDVITSVGDKKVYETDDLISALRSKEGRVSLSIVRHGAKRTIESELDKSPRAMRLGRGQGMMGFDNGNRRGKRIVIRNSDHDNLQREVGDLRNEVKELRRQLDDMKKKN